MSVTLNDYGDASNNPRRISGQQIVIGMGDAMTGIAAADFNSDGKMDLAAVGGHSVVIDHSKSTIPI